MQQDIQTTAQLSELRQRNTELEKTVEDLEATNAHLKESAERFRAVAESSLDGICIIAPDGTIEFWNNAAEERFFRSLKSERLASCQFATRRSAELEVLDYIT